MTVLTVVIPTGLAFDPTGLVDLDSPDFELLTADAGVIEILRFNGYIDRYTGSNLGAPDGLVTGYSLLNSVDNSTVFTLTDFTLPFDQVGGEAGDIVFQTLQGNDDLLGSIGPDRFFGFEGNDLIVGNGGGDVIYGNRGADIIYGNQDADFLFGGQGDDAMFGGQGVDVLYGNLAGDQLYGNLADDFLYGGAGSDRLFGGKGADVLQGNRDDDVLFGNRDDDVLDGGPGADTLVGGEGADFFVLRGDVGADLILDFEAGIDLVGAEQVIDVFDTQNGAIINTGVSEVIVLGIDAASLSARLVMI
ncbi:MAG: calcium-binding protein [Alphaproteobacteria bacterium]|nr:calcium-binding protein [Alphaproteobacteria bacterium SS10]